MIPSMLGRPRIFRKSLLDWYANHRRELPWRVLRDAPAGNRPDPYHVLVSEAMLQQTQVATVISYFLRFVAHLPTLADLASAEEQEVLRLWQGLGYYSRARHLLRTAKIVSTTMGGELPREAGELMRLPGIGPYTAGAIASLAFDRRAPVLDGNVMRVLCRLDGVTEDPRRPAIRQELWDRAEQLLPPSGSGDFNSALMELGATVCTPRGPKCPHCPVQAHCVARASESQERIPARAAGKSRPTERRWTLCIRNGAHWLIEQRPARGRWAGLWQFITLPANGGRPTPSSIANEVGIRVRRPITLGAIRHDLTHRRYEFEVFICDAIRTKTGQKEQRPDRAWVQLQRLGDFPLPRPQVRMAAMLQDWLTRNRS